MTCRHTVAMTMSVSIINDDYVVMATQQVVTDVRQMKNRIKEIKNEHGCVDIQLSNDH